MGWGCLIAAAGTVGMSQIGTTTPFAWPAVCYALVGVGFGLLVPSGSAAAMSRLPEGSSGIGSGLFNACRQIGTAVGLGIMGSIATSAIVADWHRRAMSLPAGRQRAAGSGPRCRPAAEVHLVAASAGRAALDPAVASFLRGFELALVLSGAILVAAALVGLLGLRHLRADA